MTQQDLIAAALLEIQVISPGDAVDGATLNSASTVLTHMLDAWQADKLYIFSEQRQVFVPATLKQTYTLGTGGDFNVARPARIGRYGVINLANPVQPVELPIDSLTEAQWASIPVKNISSAIPQRVWNDLAFPLMNLNYWPVPNVTINFVVYNWVLLSTFPDMVTDVTFPPGYLEALRTNLPLRLAPSFGAAAIVSPLLTQLAVNAINRIKVMNVKIIDLKCDPMLVSPEKQVYDWRSDTRVGPG